MANVVGGWDVVEMQACNLPEEAATGFTAVTEHLVGAKYLPVLYVGTQVVHGTNYMILCKQTLAVPGATEHLVKMVINGTPEGQWSIVSVEQIV